MGGASYKYFRHWSWYSFHFCITPERDPSGLWKRNHESQTSQGLKLCVFHAALVGKCENDYHKSKSTAYHKGYKILLCICLIAAKEISFYLYHKELKKKIQLLCPHWNPNWSSLALLNMPQLCDLLSYEKTGTAASPFRIGFLSNSSIPATPQMTPS